eukprot:CAMPEP_0174702312 /NCGR_PEP_ID=MMETSP1094-20130205/6632_1 /TAXON_ID=156173 /ORGANISM="Chrysochromulina brevifilum, Strain UTEX LB 985" /LENGTH=187 /DNA_ID=CAMNT_0015900071 /DNA_START=735 /DNA_END=1298 /DNA_ORIENTATION=-
MSASGRKRVRRDDASSAHDIFETELAEILRRPDGTPGDRLHLATDLWETTQQKFPTAVPGFFTRLRGWVNDSFADDAAERLLFNRVQQMDGPAVAEEVRTIPSVDEEEADEVRRLPAAARQVRLLRYLLEMADEYGEDEGENCDEFEGEEDEGEEDQDEEDEGDEDEGKEDEGEEKDKREAHRSKAY